MNTELIDNLARRYELDSERFKAQIEAIIQQTGRQEFFIFRTSGQGAAGSAPKTRQRSLIAFPSPDSALSFAQRNRLHDPLQPVRTRRLTLLQLMEAMLRDANVYVLVLADDSCDDVGRLPAGLHVHRTELLRKVGRKADPDSEVV